MQNLTSKVLLRRVWRYQRGNQNPYIEEEQHNDQKIPKGGNQNPYIEEEQHNDQKIPKGGNQNRTSKKNNTMTKWKGTTGRSTKHTHKTKDRVTRTPLN